jgi:hypothetical protein
MGYNLTQKLYGYTLVQDITVSSATTSVSFTGLNITSADDYLLIVDIINATASSQGHYLYFNSNTTGTNYYRQQIYCSSTSVSGSRSNEADPFYTVGNQKTFGIARIKLTNSGFGVVQASTNYSYGGSSLDSLDRFMTTTFTMSSITSLTVTSQFSNAIGVGSRFRLYKLNATKVADITVSTATTSVDITGLNIGKSSEYMLVSDVVNNYSGDANVGIYFNGNGNTPNYYTQQIYADSTTVSGSRFSWSDMIFILNAKKSLAVSNIKLTNNGNVITQTNVNTNYGTASTALLNRNSTSTATFSSINQINIIGWTNGIGVGSRFQLYRLKT